MRTSRRRIGLALAGSVALSICSFAQAQGFPERPVRLIVPYAAGGGTDVLVRQVAKHAAPFLGQQIIIDNKPGAGTTIAAAEVARAQPDGYTVMWGDNATFALNPHLYPKLSYDPLALSLVTLTVKGSLVLSASSGLGVRTVPELISYAKAHPGKLSYGSPGNASPHHLAMEAFKLRAGKLSIQHVPYKGEAPALQDLMAGNLDLMFSGSRIAKAQADTGKIALLATSGPARNPVLPDVPTIAEAGLPGFSYQYWHGLVAPPKTPAEVIAKLNAAFTKALSQPELLAWIASTSGAETAPSTPAQMHTFMREEIAKSAEIVKAIGLKVD